MNENKIFPGDWKEIVKGKKVILYNTSVSNMLQGKEKHIKKMKWVFQVFQRHPEVVLWWRPHPLELSTIESMIPSLTTEYVEMRKDYKDKRIGVLDESADLHRAIAVSDAYYGDWSSVSQLYKAAGKPVLYADDAITRVTPTAFLPITFCVKEEGIWFIQCNSNKLIMVDRFTYEVKKIISIPFEPPFHGRDYNYHMVDIGNSLLILLGKSRRIYEYEIETDVISEHQPQIDNFTFVSKIVIEKDNRLLMFPYRNNMILEYDYCTNAVNRREFGRNGISLSQCFEKSDAKVFFADKESNALYQYDIISGSHVVIQIGEEDSRYWGVKKACNCFVLPNIEKKAITLWNEETGEITVLTDFPEKYTCLDGMAYLDMFKKDGYIYIFPFYANMILKIDVENKTIAQAFKDVFFDIRYDLDTETDGRMYLCAKRYQNYIYAYAIYRKRWQVFDLSTMEMQESPTFEIKKNEHKNMIESILDRGIYDESFCEGEWDTICCLDNYIKNLQDSGIGKEQREADKDSAGLRIHKMILRELR